MLKSVNKSSLSPDVLEELMICASENNIKRIKEIIEESKRQTEILPTVMPPSHHPHGSIMPGFS